MIPFDWPTPKTPVWCKIRGPILNRAELLWILCWNFQIFVTMATGAGLTQISLI